MCIESCSKFSRLQKLSRYRFCITLNTRFSNKRLDLSELKFDATFCETEAEILKQHALS